MKRFQVNGEDSRWSTTFDHLEKTNNKMNSTYMIGDIGSVSVHGWMDGWMDEWMDG